MKTTAHSLMRRAVAVVATGLALGGLFATPVRADMYRMTLNSGGGVPAQATIGNFIYSPNSCTLFWYGMEGWYTIQATTNIATGPWLSLTTVAATDYAWQTTVANPDPTNSYTFRLSQANSYAGSSACGGCHGSTYTPYLQTAHASAYSALVNSHQNNNPSCLLCHTVGFNQPTGFTNATLTANLENVGCENCHGPAGWHKNSDHSLIIPAVSIAPEICGSCHQGHDPQYNEYITTLHAQVNDDVKYGFDGGVYYTNTVVVGGQTLYGYYVTTNANLTLQTNSTTGIVNSSYIPGSQYDPGADRQVGCGMCHSGATRMAMLADYQNRQNGVVAPLALPTANDSGAWGPTCAVCHDPHSDYNVAQLRNPTWSSNYFTMATTADKRYQYFTNFNGTVSSNVVFYGTTFSGLYNPNINVCGQCHNTRGARWDGRAYGLVSTVVVGSPVTNIAYVDVYTYVTNIQVFTNSSGVPYLTNAYIYSYNSGRYATNVVVTPTNTVVSLGLTTNVTGFSRAPHNSVQYNILVGILQPDYLNTTNGKTVYTNTVVNNGLGIYATHSGIAPRSVYNTNQCATCHVPTYTVNGASVTGHTFEMDVNGCALGGCHTSGWPDYIGYQMQTTNNIARVVDLLNRWATNNGPAVFGANYSKYKQNAWEYTAPGVLAGVTNAGPSTADQLKLPAVIQQARFDVYMVRNDGSLGVHNPTFVPILLKDAESKVMNQFVTAKFSAPTADIGVNGSVTFTNWNPGVTACTWDFGDNSTSTSTANTVAHQYTAPGSYTVKLTATDGNGTETLVRNNYVNVYVPPTPSFLCTPGVLTHQVTVNFTNTSANAEYGKWSFYDATGSLSTTHRYASVAGMTASFTYTNAGTYTVVLQANNVVGSANVTNTVTVQ